MGSTSALVEMTIILSYMCAAVLICYIQANSFKQTYYVCVYDMSQVFKSVTEAAAADSQLITIPDSQGHSFAESEKFDHSLAIAGEAESGHSVAEAEFEDSDWESDILNQNELLSMEAEEEIREGNLSILCWLALVTSTTRQSAEQGILMWRAPCYKEIAQQQDDDGSSECHIWVSRRGELTITFADGEEAYRSNSTVSGVEHVILTEENELLLLDEDQETIWSSRDNKVFNCID